MNEEDARFDSGFDDGEYFSVSPEPGGVSLESALHEFGPAAIDDLIPRLRAIAHALDAAHSSGAVHGALHPNRIFVTDTATSVVAGRSPVAPYAAPEVIGGQAAGPRADQFALAAIAYEWLFGKPIHGPADRAIELRMMPGVDRGALAKAFSRALARDPWDRFASCGEFVDAVAASVVPELPLAFDSERDHAFVAHDALTADDDDDPVGPFMPEEPAAVEAVASPAFHDSDASDEIDVPLRTAEPDPLPLAPVVEREPEPTPVDSWNPSAAVATTRDSSQRFGATALILATLVGAVFGFAAGYMAKPRALQVSEAEQQKLPVAPGMDAPVESASGAPSDKREMPSAAAAAPAAKPPQAPPTRESVGRLLVRSTPSGASVTVDGVAKGVTPVALRDLDVGTRTVTVARRGYISETRRIQITKARPARTVDIRLAAEASASAAKGRSGETSPELARSRASVGGAPRPSTPATLGKPAVTTGGLTVDSRPSGASVVVNGRASGKTPVTINDLAPGEYRILMTMPGYRDFAATVQVVGGERTRAAYSLTAVEQE